VDILALSIHLAIPLTFFAILHPFIAKGRYYAAELRGMRPEEIQNKISAEFITTSKFISSINNKILYTYLYLYYIFTQPAI
jgi:hypothetical protein